MRGDAKVLQHLNKILRNELTAINQYFLHSRMLRNWGVTKLGAREYEESIGEMKHADELIERVLFLEGVPNMQRLAKVKVGERVAEQLKLDLDLEIDAVAKLNKAIALCGEVGDNGSRELLEDVLESEEEHVNWLEAQLELIQQVGEENYLAQQMRK